MTDEIRIDSELAYAEFIRDFRKDWLANKCLLVKYRPAKQRTLTQNNAVHLFCEMLANELNAAGLDMRKTLKSEVEIPWSMPTVKAHLWKPIQEVVIGKSSTAEADRNEYSQVYDVLARHLAQKLSIVAPEWPRKHDAA